MAREICLLKRVKKYQSGWIGRNGKSIQKMRMAMNFLKSYRIGGATLLRKSQLVGLKGHTQYLRELEIYHLGNMMANRINQALIFLKTFGLIGWIFLCLMNFMTRDFHAK